MRMNNRYDEIVNLPHHVSKTRPQMPMSDRAAQFAPFAALTGYDSAIKETGRLTDEIIDNQNTLKKDLIFQRNPLFMGTIPFRFILRILHPPK